MALATPLPTTEACYSLNVSVSTEETIDEVVGALSAALLQLKEQIMRAIALRADV